jgi:hypothetical protein
MKGEPDLATEVDRVRQVDGEVTGEEEETGEAPEDTGVEEVGGDMDGRDLEKPSMDQAGRNRVVAPSR